MHDKHLGLRLIVLAAVMSAAISALHAAEEEEVNNGQDITRPLTRLDIRYGYQNVAGSPKDDNHIMTLRMDRPFSLGEKWKLATRFDVPFMTTNRINPDNPGGSYHFGLSDILVQGMLVHTATETFAWAVGLQAIFPTASEDGMGAGKYQLIPILAGRWKMDRFLKGSWIALASGWAKDIASRNPNSPHINNLEFAPIINIPLPNRWFVNLFPSTDFKYNLGKKRPGDTGRWFVPADVLIGKMLRKNVVGSLEVSVPIIKQYQVYDFKTEFRIGILF